MKELLFLASCWSHVCGGGHRGQRESLWKDSGTSASTSSGPDGFVEGQDLLMNPHTSVRGGYRLLTTWATWNSVA